MTFSLLIRNNSFGTTVKLLMSFDILEQNCVDKNLEISCRIQTWNSIAPNRMSWGDRPAAAGSEPDWIQIWHRWKKAKNDGFDVMFIFEVMFTFEVMFHLWCDVHLWGDVHLWSDLHLWGDVLFLWWSFWCHVHCNVMLKKNDLIIAPWSTSLTTELNTFKKWKGLTAPALWLHAPPLPPRLLSTPSPVFT